MRLCCCSDLHGYHRQIKIPEDTDLIIFAGDITNIGEFDILADFNLWLKEINKPSVIIAGNHDKTLEQVNGKDFITNGIYLRDEMKVVEGLKIYGSPMSRKVGNWAFGYTPLEAHRVWNKIPTGIDILVTHGPPLGILDLGLSGDRLGCYYLKERLKIVRPRIHVVGHVHEDRGIFRTWKTIYVNAAICNFPDYGDLREPIMIDFDKEKEDES